MLTTLACIALFQVLDRVTVDATTREVTLAARNVELRDMAASTRYDVVTDLTVWRGDLYAAVCMKFGAESMYAPLAYSNGAQILRLDVAGGEWTPVYDEPGSMLFNLRAVGDRLMAPEYFPFDDASRRIHAYDGEAWRDLGLLPTQAWHIMDVRKIGACLYASGSWRDAGEAAQGEDPDWWAGYGHVFASTDDGATWTDLRRTQEKGRILDLVEFRGRVYANERGMQLICWDGKAWQEIPVRLAGLKDPVRLGNAHLAVFAGCILATQAELMYRYDGRAWTSQQPGAIDLWVDGGQLYGLRDDGSVWQSADAVQWRKVTTKSGAPAEEFRSQAPKGRPLHRGAVAVHRARLYVGGGATGKIFAAPYETSGSVTSEPAEFDPTQAVALRWDARGDRLRLRVRAASTRADLFRAVWRDVAESGAAFPRERTHRWVQWRAEFTSDGNRSAVLRSAEWTTTQGR